MAANHVSSGAMSCSADQCGETQGLEAPLLGLSDRLRLMNAVDDLCLPWQLDLVLRHELPAEFEAHVQRVGHCLWIQP